MQVQFIKTCIFCAFLLLHFPHASSPPIPITPWYFIFWFLFQATTSSRRGNMIILEQYEKETLPSSTQEGQGIVQCDQMWFQPGACVNNPQFHRKASPTVYCHSNAELMHRVTPIWTAGGQRSNFVLIIIWWVMHRALRPTLPFV